MESDTTNITSRESAPVPLFKKVSPAWSNLGDIRVLIKIRKQRLPAQPLKILPSVTSGVRSVTHNGSHLWMEILTLADGKLLCEGIPHSCPSSTPQRSFKRCGFVITTRNTTQQEWSCNKAIWRGLKNPEQQLEELHKASSENPPCCSLPFWETCNTLFQPFDTWGNNFHLEGCFTTMFISVRVEKIHIFWLPPLQGSILPAVPLSLNIFVICNSPFLKQVSKGLGRYPSSFQTFLLYFY